MRIVINSEFITGQVQVDFGNGFETIEPADYASGIHIPEGTDLSAIRVKANSTVFNSLDVLYNAAKFSRTEDLTTKTLDITSNGNAIEFLPEEGEEGWNKILANVNVQPNLQAKEVSYSSRGEQEVVADNGYDGLSSVTVNVNVPEPAIQTLEKQVLTENKTYNFDVPEGKDGLGNLEVEVAVPLEEEHNEPLIVGAGSYTINPEVGFTAMKKVNVVFEPKLQPYTVAVDKTTTDTNAPILPADGFDGFSEIRIDVDEANFVQDPNLGSKTIDVTDAVYTQVYNASDDGFDGYQSVAINVAVPLEENQTVQATLGQTLEVTPSDSNVAMKKVTVNVPAVRLDTPNISELEITENGQKTFIKGEDYDGLNDFTVNVNVQPDITREIDVSEYDTPISIEGTQGLISLINYEKPSIKENDSIEISLTDPESNPRVTLGEDGEYIISSPDGFAGVGTISVKIIDDRPIINPDEFIITDDEMNITPSDFVVQDDNND